MREKFKSAYRIFLALLGWLFKLLGISAVVFGILLAKQVIESRTYSSALRNMDDVYYLAALLIYFSAPVFLGLLSLFIGALIDVWLAVNRRYDAIEKLVKESRL